MANRPEVTKADRETYTELFPCFPDECSRVMAGECDDYDEIQIIARHREKSCAALQAENARLRDCAQVAELVEAMQIALLRAIDLSKGQFSDDMYVTKQKLDQTHGFLKRFTETALTKENQDD